jgi:hypothetical protein
MQRSWSHLRGDAALSYGLTASSTQQEWIKLGPLFSFTPTNAKNRGVADTKLGMTESSGQRINQSTGQSVQEVDDAALDQNGELDEIRETVA